MIKDVEHIPTPREGEIAAIGADRRSISLRGPPRQSDRVAGVTLSGAAPEAYSNLNGEDARDRHWLQPRRNVLDARAVTLPLAWLEVGILLEPRSNPLRQTSHEER